MYRTLPLLRMSSTKVGMRSILRYRIPIADYIRLAVNSGTYYDVKGMARQRRKQRETQRVTDQLDELREDDDEEVEDADGNENEEDTDENFLKAYKGNVTYDPERDEFEIRDYDEDDEDDDDNEEEKEEEDEDEEKSDRQIEEDDIAAVEREIGLKSIVHGTSVLKYPVEYEILTQYPGIPFRPNTPKRFRTKPKPQPTKILLDKHMKREQRKQQQANPEYMASIYGDPAKPYMGPANTEEYYYRILHMTPPGQVLQHKSATMVKAYAVVQKQYELMRTQDLSEQQALDQVEQLLQQEQTNDKFQSRAVQKHVKSWRQQQHQQHQQHQRDTHTNNIMDDATMEPPPSRPPPSSPEEMQQWKDSSPTLLWNKPHVLFGMAKWGRRLKAVPYQKWTVGAITSLDHWIARQVLQISEKSWQNVLEGNDPSLRGIGRDLIAVRHALFPETMLASQSRRQEEEAYDSMYGLGDAYGRDDKKGKEDDEDVRTIDELLESLGGADFARKYQEQLQPSATKDKDEHDQDELDRPGELTNDKIKRLVDQLQEWRAKQLDQPYEEWNKDDQRYFDIFLNRYLNWFAPGEKVDREATRMALLSSPPTTEAKSKSFWDQLKDETDAQILLDRMLKDGPPDPASSTSDYPPQINRFFWELSYDEQLQKLLDLGTLRPILDEYASEKDRTKFWEKYSRIMLEGVELEHLVPDPNGPILASSLDDATLAQFGIDRRERFRIEKVPFGTDTDSYNTPARQRARDLYQAWNWHKASRARYEERLYQLGRLGLVYDHEYYLKETGALDETDTETDQDDDSDDDEDD